MSLPSRLFWLHKQLKGREINQFIKKNKVTSKSGNYIIKIKINFIIFTYIENYTRKTYTYTII